MSGGVLVEYLVRGHDVTKPVLQMVARLGACVIVYATIDLAILLLCRILSLRVNSEQLFEMMQALPPPLCPTPVPHPSAPPAPTGDGVPQPAPI